MKNNKEEIIKMEINPVVTLVVVSGFGSVCLMESLGGEELANVLKLAASSGDDYPIEKSDNLLDCVGQEVYVCNSHSYIKSISGCFFHISTERSEELLKICEKEDLIFSFVVSY